MLAPFRRGRETAVQSLVVISRREAFANRAPVTMKDVAEAAGVAQSTVSRILNDVPERIPISVERRASASRR